MATYTRSNFDVVTPLDALGALPDNRTLPQHIHIRHTGKGVRKDRRGPTVYPAITIPHRDWSNNRTSGVPPTTGRFDGNVITLRRGKSVSILSEIFASWTESPKGQIAQFMNSGFLEVYEDYLGTTRKLSSGHVQNYRAQDNPWVTYVLHRAKPNGTADAVPTAMTNGTVASSYHNLKVRLSFTGGTAPAATINVWHRDVEPGVSGLPWVAGEVHAAVTHMVETTVSNGYREIYIQLTSITGSPTAIDIELSGSFII